MPKPTLLQSLLGRPSRSYAFPPDRQHYSVKDQLACVAAALPSSTVISNTAVATSSSFGGYTEVPPPPTGVEHPTYQRRVSLSTYLSSDAGIQIPSSTPSSQQQITSDFNTSDLESDDDQSDDVFYTPFSSPPTSMLVDPPISLVPPSLLSPDDKSTSSSSSSSTPSSHSAISCSTPPTSDELHAALTELQKRPGGQSRSKRASTPSKSYTYTDDDWAKEFRWLVSPSAAASKRRSVDLDETLSALPPTVATLPRPRPRPRTVVSRPITRSRMTALLEEDEDATDEPHLSPAPSHVRDAFTPPLSRTNTSNSHGARFSTPASQPHTISLNSRTVEVPQFPSTSAPTSSTGYTTLTLPRASYRPEDPWRSIGSGRVDLARDGRAQVSMVSIEVVRGAASISFLSSNSRKRNSAPRLKNKYDLTGTIALASRRPPPSYVPNSDVLVQVYAVGLEGLDRQIVRDKIAWSDAGGKGATGFVPGRGVLGRVVECGLEVSAETLKKGEWVVGLLDAKKCGALSEFVVIDRHRLHRAPQPSIPVPLPLPTADDLAPSFSLESLALLPVLGIPAYRAVRTYTASVSPLTSGSGTALVLRGQDGAGGLATLMLRAIGVNVIVQVDPSAVGYDSAVNSLSQPYMLFSQSDDKSLGTSVPRRLKEVCAHLRARGVEGICVGAPLDVLHSLDVDVDFVLDTIGGREIWDAARDLLSCGSVSRGPAQFTTIVGDARSGKAVPTMQDNWRASVQSLKRAMTVGRGSGRSLGLGSSGSQTSPSNKLKSRQRIPSLLASTPPPVLQPPRPSSSLSSASTAVAVRLKSSARTVDYSWVSCVADVDSEGGDARDALAALLDMPALQHPSPDALLGLGGEYGAGRVLPFERAPEAFEGHALEAGGTCVIRVVL